MNHLRTLFVLLKAAKDELEASQRELQEMMQRLEESKSMEAEERQRLEEEIRMKQEEVSTIYQQVKTKEEENIALQSEMVNARVKHEVRFPPECG